MPQLTAALVVSFYRIWHGKLHLKGAGLLIRRLLPFLPALYQYRLQIQEGHAITLDFRDASAFYWLNHVCGDRYEEDGLLTAVKQHGSENDVVWDVGANCGLFSYRLATESCFRKVIFFEPNPAMFRLASSALEHLPNATGHECALSDCVGTADLTIPEGKSTMGTLESFRTLREGITASIECMTGDDLIARGIVPAPRIIKIDTEGHEASVILGLQETISRYKPIIFFEHISLADAVIKHLMPADYTIYSVSNIDGSLLKGFDRSRGHNSAFVPVC
jgi:FkbM family methyltransferase